MLVGAGLCLRG